MTFNMNITTLSVDEVMEQYHHARLGGNDRLMLSCVAEIKRRAEPNCSPITCEEAAE